MKKSNKFIAKGLIAGALLMGLVTTGVGAAPTYKDVPASHHAADSIKFLTDRNIIEGFPDNTFRPEAAVTRAEASRIITGATKFLEVDYPAANKRNMITFKDVQAKHWYSVPITNMYQNRILNGFPDKSFRPNETVTKAQLSRMISDAFQMENKSVKLPFTDVKATGWYMPAIGNLYSSKIIPQAGTQFKPNAKMARAEVSQYVAKAMLVYAAANGDEPIDDDDEIIVPWDGTTP